MNHNLIRRDSEIRSMRAEMRAAEMQAGRYRTLKSMADGLLGDIVPALRLDLGTQVNLVTNDKLDFRNWSVLITHPKHLSVHLHEKFIDFPSDHMKAQLLLLGLMKDK